MRTETRSEMVERIRPMEDSLRKRAAQGQRLRRLARHKPGLIAPPPMGCVREILANLTGVHGRTYEMARQIVDAAAEAPEKFADLVATMDATGSVGTVYKVMQDRVKGIEGTAKIKRYALAEEKRMAQVSRLSAEKFNAAQIADKIGVSRGYVMKMANRGGIKLVDRVVGGTRDTGMDYNRIVEETVMDLEATVMATDMVLGHVGQLDAEQLDFWGRSLRCSLRQLHELKREIIKAAKEARNDDEE